VFTWWQLKYASNQMSTASVSDICWAYNNDNKKAIDQAAVTTAITSLVKQGLVYNTKFTVRDRAKAMKDKVPTADQTFAIMESYRPAVNSATIGPAIAANKPGSKAAAPAKTYQQSAKQAGHDDFHTFLNHGYLQLSTNVLHDYFCMNGLWVHSDEGSLGYKIYGDNSMLQKESRVGVVKSAQTSNMSRDSIYQIAEKGQPDNGHRLADIAKRLPRSASTVQGSVTVSLENWHQDNGGLHDLCFNTVFPDASKVLSKSTAIASDKLAEKISRDVHVGDAF